MNSRQIAENQVNELWVSGAIRMDQRSEPFCVLSPTVARDEHL